MKYPLRFTIEALTLIVLVKIPPVCCRTNIASIIINTTSCTMNSVPNGKLSYHKFLDKNISLSPFNYTICTIDLGGNGSRLADIVVLTGKNGLVIQSHGKIEVSQALLAGPPLAGDDIDMWLGGYCTRNSEGRGPGFHKNYGSGHGQLGVGADIKNGTKYGWEYGFNNNNIDLIGGSSGAVLSGTNVFSCGGGVVKILSNTSITINATISTNAIDNVTNDSCVSGGSGGTLVLVAPKITLTSEAKLFSKGKMKHCPMRNIKGCHCGSGGVIVINGTITGAPPDPYNNTRANHICKSGTVIINAEAPRGCFFINKTFQSDLPYYKVKLTNCRNRCKTASFVLLHERICKCLQTDDGFERVEEKLCNKRCFASDLFICGGENKTHNFYSLYNCTVETSGKPSLTKSMPTNSEEMGSTPTLINGKSSTLPVGKITLTPSNIVSTGYVSMTLTTNNSSHEEVKITPSTTLSTTDIASPKSKRDEYYQKELAELTNVPMTKNNSKEIVSSLKNIIKNISTLKPTDLHNTLSIMEAVFNGGKLEDKTRAESVEIGQDILNIGVKLLDSSATESWETFEQTENKSREIILYQVERIMTRLGGTLEVNETISLVSEKFGFYKEIIDPSQFTGRHYVFSGFQVLVKSSTIPLSNSSETDEAIVIPESLVDKVNGSSPFSINILKFTESATQFQSTSPDNGLKKPIVKSNVISISLNRPLQGDLKEMVALTFPSLTKVTSKQTCVFLDVQPSEKTSWSTRGCTTSIDPNGSIVCLANHFTSFAVLVDVSGTHVNSVHHKPMMWITYIGCGISLVCLILTMTTFAFLKLLTTDNTMIHFHLSLALSLAQILFLLGSFATQNEVPCKVIAIFLHYFYTSAICWMCVEGIHLFRKVVQVFIRSNDKKYYCLLGWGLPLVIVAISVLGQLDGYGSQHACWLSVQGGLIWAFIIPILIMVTVNIVILLLVIRVMVVAIHSEPAQDGTSHLKTGVKGIIFLLPLLGLTWVFGVLAVNSATLFFQYAFTILNSLQGFFIFLFHCVLNTEVRNAFKRQQIKLSLQRSFHDSSNKTNKTKDAKTSARSSKTATPMRIRVSPMPDLPDQDAWKTK